MAYNVKSRPLTNYRASLYHPPHTRSLSPSLEFLGHSMSSFENGPGTSSCTVPRDFYDLYLTTVIVRPDAFRPTGVLKVVVNDGLVKKCGDFTAIYAGEVLTEAPHDTVPKRVAIKWFRDHTIRQGVLSTLQTNAEDMLLLSKHPNICRTWLLTSSIGPIPAAATPWFGNGNVVDFIRHNIAIDKLNIVKQIANAIGYIHAIGKVHGNILPSNVMITDDERPCITDVGMNARLSRIKYSGPWPLPSGWMFKAPEELSPQFDLSIFSPTKQMDVYAFASTVYSIFTLKPPFPVKSYGTVAKIIQGHVPQKPIEISAPMWNLLNDCWSYNPEDRPSMAAIESALRAFVT